MSHLSFYMYLFLLILILLLHNHNHKTLNSYCNPVISNDIAILNENMIGRKIFLQTAYLGTGISLCTTYYKYNYNTDEKTKEGLQRSITFWYNIFPLYIHYRFYQLLNRDLRIMSDESAHKKYDQLHEKYTDHVKNIVYKMRGFYLKNAQMMSTQDDFVPKAYMKWVKDTQDNVPSEFKDAEAREYVKIKLREELNLEFEDVFSFWDDEPLGVASIGQVHKAKLKSNGKIVAVKVLVPGIENRFRSDINTIRSFCKLAMPQHVTAFNEIEKQFCSEFDYVEEAKNLRLVHSAITPKWGTMVQIPLPYTEYCSKHILVMEYLEGIKLVDGIRKQYKILADHTGMSLEAMEAERKAAIESGKYVFQTIEQTKKERAQMQWYYACHDYLLNTNNLWKVLYNFSALRLFYGPIDLERTPLPVDLGATLELLCHVHASELFEHGVFNGDPHPGNIMLLTDGRLGLIDYGQVKKMTIEERVIYAKVIIAHSRGDKDEVVRLHFEEQGVRTKKMDPDVAYLFSAFYNDRDSEDVCKGMNVASFIDFLEAKDAMIQLPEAYIFASRVNLMLRGMGKAFGLQLKMSDLWKHEAHKFLKSQNIHY